jgi:hypothetical protein
MAGCKAQAKQIDTSTVYEQPRKDHNGDRADGEAGSPTVVTRTSCADKKERETRQSTAAAARTTLSCATPFGLQFAPVSESRTTCRAFHDSQTGWGRFFGLYSSCEREGQ